jgi:tetratricopeptide (TPR) repeat protein
MVQSAGQGRSELTAEQVDESIRVMKELCDKTGDTTMLSKSLQNLAAELQGQLETSKNPEQQAKLANCFKILIDQLTGVSSDPGVIESGGAAMIVLASNLEKVPALASKATEMMAIAEKAYTKLSQMPAAELEKIKRKPEELMLKLAITKRGAGKYEEANKLLVEALTKNQSNITVQIEAAKNLQQWAAGKDVEKLKMAMLGAEPQANKKKLVWGWGQIAQTTVRFPNFQKEFFEARLNIAKCRAMIADNSGTEKQKLYDAAIADITQTYSRFPELGGVAMRGEFDRLLREVQQKAGKQPTGIAGLPVPDVKPAEGQESTTEAGKP